MDYKDILAEMLAIHTRKNHDYAAEKDSFSNFTYAADFARPFTDSVDKTFATIIGIKFARLINLQGKNAVNESVIDTFRDITIYMSLWWNYRENHLDQTQYDSSKVREAYPKCDDSNCPACTRGYDEKGNLLPIPIYHIPDVDALYYPDALQAPILYDINLPNNEIQLRNKAGKVVARIILDK